MANVLISRTDRIGDLVLSLPVLEALKVRNPNWRVGYLVNRYTAPLLENHPLLDYVIKVEVSGDGRGGIKDISELKRVLSQVKMNSIDIALVLHSKPSIAFLFYLAKVKERVGISGRYYSFLYTKKVRPPRKSIHTVERNLLFLKALGVDAHLLEPKLYLTRDELKVGDKLWGFSDKKRVLLHLSSKTAKTWPEDRFCRLAEYLVESDFKVALTGRYRNCRGGECLSYSEDLDLRRLMALIKKANLVVAGSTGVLHIAAALRTPTFALFDPSFKDHVIKWRPMGDTHKIFVPQKDLREITPEMLKGDIISFFKKYRDPIQGQG